MARLSRLLSAISLGVAVTAAVGAAVVAVEYNPVRRAPAHLAEGGSHGRVIVKFRENASIMSASKASIAAVGAGVRMTTGPQAASTLGGRLGLALADGRILGTRTQVMTANGMSSAALAKSLAADADVEWAVVDERRFALAAAVDDPLYPDGLSTAVAPNGPVSGQWYLRAPTSSDANGRAVVSSINVEPAWAITHGASSIIMGDIDTGITQHPDLDSKILAGYDFIGWGVTHTDFNAGLGTGSPSQSNALATANDGNLADSDPSDPGDWVTAAENSNKNGPFYACNDSDKPNPGQPVPENSSWHGTQTAGILGAATNNGIGMAGTAYNSPVIPARALGKCGGFDSDIIAAAEWSGGIAVSGVGINPHPARVINMSLGSSGSCNAAYVDAFTALRNKGVVVVAAAGNDVGLPVSVPANCKPAASDSDQTPVVIAVAGLRHAGTKVGFSDIGPEVTIAAPGGNCVNTASGTPCLYPIVTTTNSGTTTPLVNGGTYSDGLNHISLGTSFATPMVAGTVALMLSAAPNLTNAQVVDILKSTARPFPTVSDAVSPTPQPPVCTVPTASSAKQDECICTTSTCGAGMLDAGAAVTAAAALSTGAAVTYTAPTAAASPTTTTVVAGKTVTIDGTASTPGSSGAALAYQWTISSGSSAITLGTATSSSVVVTGVSAGTAQVTLTVTDPTSGLRNSTTASITVTAAPPSSSGGGGGAAHPAWLAALALVGLLLGPRARRTRG
jgi:serine protease